MSVRPAGIFFARTGLGAGARMCCDPSHGVYERRMARGRAPAGGATPVVTIYACEVCWPRGQSGARSERAPAWDGWGECLEGPLIGDGQKGCGAGPETAEKHERHRGTLVPYVAVMRKHAHRFPPDVFSTLLLDLTTGPLRYRDAAGVAYTGTGALALEAFDLAGLRSYAVFFEKVPAFAEHAEAVLARRPDSALGDTVVVRGDAWTWADDVLTMIAQQRRARPTLRPFGFLSLDANGEPDLEALGGLYRTHAALLEYVDIWIHLPAQIMKLIRRVHGRGLLRDRILALPKRVWKIRPSGAGGLGWVELVGTNWEDAPTWRSQRFLDLRSPEGVAALDAETFTRAERRERDQLALELEAPLEVQIERAAAQGDWKTVSILRGQLAQAAEDVDD